MALQLKKGSIPPHPLTKLEIKEYYENKPRSNGVFSRENLPKTIKDRAYVINLDEYADVATHWIVFLDTFVLDSLILLLQIKV